MKICLSCEGVTSTSASRCGHCGAWLLPTDAVHYPLRRGEIDSGNPLLGTVVDGKYRLQGVLGRGGLGTVFRAQHVGSLVTVALKLLHPRFAERPEYRRALIPEARRAATVTHERCARLLDVGEAEDGVTYLAMELVEGKTLEVLTRGGALQPSHAVDVLLQVAQALVAIHAVGLVHCDLSPRNVMVAPRPNELRVKVLDFGIARSVSLAGVGRPQGEFAGFVNPAFAAPELLAGGEVDPRADLYSFGTLAWLLLTGQLPIADADPRRAAAAVIAGDLQPWPASTRVPRRLARLVQRCVRHDPAARPASAAAVLRELQVVRGARRPLIVRSGVAALGLGVLATFASAGPAVPPFLRPLSGSKLALESGPLASSQATQELTSARLAHLTFDFGGFAPARLRADLVRDGAPLVGIDLRPEVDHAKGTLVLSTAQAGWRDVVQGLLRTSREGPVDLVLGVPGAARLGSARLRLDDTAPALDAQLVGGDGAIAAHTVLRYQASDEVHLASLAAVVELRDGPPIAWDLAPADREFALGQELAKALAMVRDLGAGEVRLVAHDRAGNASRTVSLPFARADVAAPTVLAVTGPLGESFVPVVAGTTRIRVRLSGAEPGLTLTIATGGEPAAPIALDGATDLHTIELAVGPHAVDAPWQFEVVDAAGNRTRAERRLDVRDRSVQVEFECADGRARWLGGELVLAERASVTARLGSNWAVDAVRVDLASPPAAPAAEPMVRWNALAPATVRLEFGALPPGGHELRIQASEREGRGDGDGDGAGGLRWTRTVPLRVLPAAIDVRVPAARSRFLAGLIDAGVLARRGDGYVEGAAWRFDAALRPYLRGTLWIGVDAPVALQLAPPGAATDALLPVVAPVPGRNRLAVELHDVLDRPVRIDVGDGPSAGPGSEPAAGLHTIADFWWHDAAPEVVGEELLVEFGQAARVRLRCPLPFQPADADELLLGIAQSEVPVHEVAPSGPDAAVLTFDVPSQWWSVAAQLDELSREQFAAQHERSVGVYLKTPAGRFDKLLLRLRTTRSTLRPTSLGELRPLPPALAALRFLPVLAPALPFAEPVPARMAPPRATFRPQVAVSVSNMRDILLLDRELACGDARALVATLPGLRAADLARCVHHEDPRRAVRMQAANLLPAASAAAPDDATLLGVDFYQAWALSRLLGLVVADDPDAFRLPLGCELELAAFGDQPPRACHGAGARGGRVSMAAFLAAPARGSWPSAATCRAAGDVVPADGGEQFVGLDFGAREWVLDLPHVVGADGVLRFWIGDCVVHLNKVMEQARGVGDPAPDPVGPLRQLGVVRGLASGNRGGLIQGDGQPLDPLRYQFLPNAVPGVLRTEQLRRDGQDLLAGALDSRLASTGFRVVGVPERLTALRGRR